MEREPVWLKLKSYPHIEKKIELKDKTWVVRKAMNPRAFYVHCFLPFIHNQVTVRKFRKEKRPDGTRSPKRKADKKVREIFYANHLDSNIYAYYSWLLSSAYEAKLESRGISDCVTAYRKIKGPSGAGKCNIDYASEVFNFIGEKCDDKLIAITFDISSFFDNLNHQMLKKAWKDVLDVEELPPHHYNVFKNITRFSYVELKDIFNEFKNDIKVKKLKHLTQKDVGSFCSVAGFKTRIREKNLIKSNKLMRDEKDQSKFVKRDRGIPQGSPISAMLANIYLLDFDAIVNVEAKKRDALYRRYSDDMVIVCREDDRDYFTGLLKREIKEFKLIIQDAKTQVFRYRKSENRLICEEWNKELGQYLDNTNFEYLGFYFDGKNVGLKSASLATYFRKMKRSVRRHKYYQKRGKYKRGQLFRNKLHKSFTHIGMGRRLIWKRKLNTTDEWEKSDRYEWGNFITYANKAHEKIGDQSIIDRQIRHHWQILHDKIAQK
jgi:hypothetical protein